METETSYSVGYAQARRLRQLAGDAGEREAIDRLADFAGTASDLRTAIAVYQRTHDTSDRAAAVALAAHL